MKILEADAKVEELINADTMAWNLNLVKEVLSKEEANIIGQIPRSHSNRLDQLVRRCTTNGIFTVQSAYHLQGDI